MSSLRRSLAVSLVVMALIFAARASEAFRGSFLLLEGGADLSVTKTGPDSASADSDVTFKITVTNLGPEDDATNVQLNDVIPAGLTFTSIDETNDPDLFTCVTPTPGTGGTIQCTAATMSVGATSTFTVVMHVSSEVAPGTTFTNVATVTSDNDPNDENNSSPASFTTSGALSADLLAAKNGPANASAGSDVNFVIQISNAGPTAAQTVSFSDVLPGDMTFVSFIQNSGPVFTCNTPDPLSGGTVSCTLATMNSGETSSFTLTGHIPSDSAASQYPNSVTVKSDTPDPNSENNTAIAVVNVSSADISITKTGPANATAGDTISWTLTVANGGPDTAVEASFFDQLPPGTVFQSLTHNTGVAPDSCSMPSQGANGMVSCSFATLAPGKGAEFTLTATIAPSVASGTVISNTATASSDNGDPNSGNNSQTANTTVNASADLSVTKSDSPDPVTAGSNLSYTITVTNNGLSDAVSPQLSDPLPPNTTLVSFTVPAGWTRTDNVPAGGTGTVTATASTLAAGANAIFSLVVNVNSNTPAASELSNTATVSSNTTDPNSENNHQTATTTVNTLADLGVTKVDSPDPVVTGSNETYTITVLNSGPSDAANLNLSDQLPPNTTLVSFTVPAGWTRTDVVPPGGTGIVTATAPSLTAGASSIFTLVVNVKANTPFGTQISNSAVVGSTTADPNSANNTGTAVTTVTGDPDLTITKSHSGNFNPGQSGTYTITVSNVGGAPTTGTVTVTDNVPVGLTPISPNGAQNGWSCQINGQTLTCTRSGPLAASASYPSIILTVNVANPGPVAATNTVTVSGGGDINTSNNSASDPTSINCSADPNLNNPNPLVISRFRENGPNGSADEFVEIFNPSTNAHTVAAGNCTGGYSLISSAGNGTNSNAALQICRIPNGTVIPAGGYYLCNGATYSLNNLGLNGGAEGATATGDSAIGCGGQCTGDIPDDAGLALVDVGLNIITICPKGTFGCPTGFNYSSVGSSGSGRVFDSVGFNPYGPGAPAPGYPSLAGSFCEGPCLQPVGDASTSGICSNPSGLFPVVPVPPACYGQAGQYEILRRQTTFDPSLGTLHQDNGNNADDFILVAPNSASNMGLHVTGVSGVTSVLGASVPQNSKAPPDMPRVNLTQSPFAGVDPLGPRNAERVYSLDPTIANPVNDPLGTFTLRLKFTNNTAKPVFPLRIRVDNLSTLCGPQTTTSVVGTGNARSLSSAPNCGAAGLSAILKLVNSRKEVVVDDTGTTQEVVGTVMEDLSVGTPSAPGPLSPFGGGVDNTVIINPSASTSSVGDGVTGGSGLFNVVIFADGPGKVLRLKLKFGVVRSGRFILLVTPAARVGPTPLAG